MADPVVAGGGTVPDDLLDVSGERAGADGQEGGAGAVACPQLLQEAAVGAAVGGGEGLVRPRLARTDRRREVVRAEIHHDELRSPGARVLPDVARHVQQRAVVEGAVVHLRGASAVVAHHAQAGVGVELVVGLQPPGGEGAVAHVRVGRAPELLAVAVAGVREAAVARGEGVADELDLAGARGRPAQHGAARRGDEPAERAGGPGRVVALDEPDGVHAVAQSRDPVGGPARRDEGRDGGSVDLDVVVGGRVVEHDSDAGPPDPALEVHAGPAVLQDVPGVLHPSGGVDARPHSVPVRRGGGDGRCAEQHQRRRRRDQRPDPGQRHDGPPDGAAGARTGRGISDRTPTKTMVTRVSSGAGRSGRAAAPRAAARCGRTRRAGAR